MAANGAGRERRRPRQARSRATWEAILEAASQIVERRGPGALNTNAIAERAGVSIGTLYQYFADKRAILLAAAERELAAGVVGDGRRLQALTRALIAMLETLGGLGGAAGGRSPRTSQPRRQARGEGWERRLLELAQGWLTLLCEAPPAPSPIPIPKPRCPPASSSASTATTVWNG